MAILKREQISPLPAKAIHRSFLRKTDLFSSFSDEMLDDVLQHALVKHYPKDALLCITGDAANSLWLVMHGAVKLFRETHDGQECVTSIRGKYDIFGRNAVIKNGHIPYSAQTVMDTEIIHIQSSFLQHMMQHHEEYDHFMMHFLENTLNEETRYTENIEHLSLMTSLERVGCFLLKLCGGKNSGSIMVTLPYEKSLAAAALGMSAETFSRSLNQLKSLGVETHQAEITINDIGLLRSTVCKNCSAILAECVQSSH